MEETNNDSPDKEPPVSSNELGMPSPYPKNRDSNPLSGISRTITDEELRDSAGARKMLLYVYDKLEKECIELNGFKDKYFESEKRLVESGVKLKYALHVFSIGDLCKVVGGIILGFAVTHMEAILWIVIGLLALVLVVGPFVYQHYVNKVENQEGERK